MRPPCILSSSSERKIRSIKIYDRLNKPMSNSGSVSCFPKCVIHPCADPEGGPGVRTPLKFENFTKKKKRVILGFFGGWTPSSVTKITIFVGPPLMKISGSAHDISRRRNMNKGTLTSKSHTLLTSN